MKGKILVVLSIFSGILAFVCFVFCGCLVDDGNSKIDGKRISEIKGKKYECFYDDTEYSLLFKNNKAYFSIILSDDVAYEFSGTYDQKDNGKIAITIDSYDEKVFYEIPPSLTRLIVTLKGNDFYFDNAYESDFFNYYIAEKKGGTQGNDGTLEGNGTPMSDEEKDNERHESPDEQNKNNIDDETGDSGQTNGHVENDTNDDTSCDHVEITITKGMTATCEEDGKEGDTICKNCGKVLKEGKIIRRYGHKGGQADCIRRAVCGVCEKEYGDLTEHTLGEEANCVHAKICGVCGKGYGGLAEHTLGEEANCVHAKICGVCGKEYGDLAEHTLGEEANCVHAKICGVCGKEYGDLTEHTLGEEANCVHAKICGVCEKEYGEIGEHKPGEEPTCIRPQICELCKTELKPIAEHNYDGKICRICEYVDRYGEYEYKGEYFTSVDAYDDSYRNTKIGTLNLEEKALKIKYLSTEIIVNNFEKKENTIDFFNPEMEDIDDISAYGFILINNIYVCKKDGIKYELTFIDDSIGYMTSTCEKEESIESDKISQENNVIKFNHNEKETVIVLNYKEESFIVAVPSFTVTYYHGGKYVVDEYSESDGYVTITAEFDNEEWYSSSGEKFSVGEKVYFGESVKLYSKAYSVIKYNGSGFETEKRGCSVFERAYLDTRIPDGYDLIGWKVGDEILSVEEIVFPDSGFFEAECVFGNKVVTNPTETENGSITEITYTVSGTTKVTTKIPKLCEENGYVVEIKKYADLINTGIKSYENETYGYYEVIIEKETYYESDDYTISLNGENFEICYGDKTYTGNAVYRENEIEFITESNGESGEEYRYAVSLREDGAFEIEAIEKPEDGKSVSISPSETNTCSSYYGFDKQTEVLIYNDGYYVFSDVEGSFSYSSDVIECGDGWFSMISNKKVLYFSIYKGAIYYDINNYEFLPKSEYKSVNKLESIFGTKKQAYSVTSVLTISEGNTYTYKNGSTENGNWLYEEDLDLLLLYCVKENHLPVFVYDINNGLTIKNNENN